MAVFSDRREHPDGNAAARSARIVLAPVWCVVESGLPREASGKDQHHRFTTELRGGGDAAPFDRQLRHLRKRATALGYQIVPALTAASAGASPWATRIGSKSA